MHSRGTRWKQLRHSHPFGLLSTQSSKASASLTRSARRPRVTSVSCSGGSATRGGSITPVSSLRIAQLAVILQLRIKSTAAQCSAGVGVVSRKEMEEDEKDVDRYNFLKNRCSRFLYRMSLGRFWLTTFQNLCHRFLNQSKKEILDYQTQTMNVFPNRFFPPHVHP